MPQRIGSFSAGYALAGLATGGVAGFAVSMMARLISAAFILNKDPGYFGFDTVAEHAFATGPVFTGGVIITMVLFALAGFFWDGSEYTGDSFLVSMGSIGLILGGIIGMLPVMLFAAVISVFGSMSDETGTVIMIVSISVFAIVGFIWNGIESCRDTFSILRSFLGIICGFLKGVAVCLSLLLTNGCIVIIIAAIFAALTSALAALIIAFYMIKGFFVVGSGGDWNDF